MQMNERYIVTGPVKDGYSWWDVVDRLSEHYPNFKMAQFFEEIPFAEETARALCAKLNEAEARESKEKWVGLAGCTKQTGDLRGR